MAITRDNGKVQGPDKDHKSEAGTWQGPDAPKPAKKVADKKDKK